MPVTGREELERFRAQYPDKFLSEEEVFAHVRRGDRIFLGTACGEPQHLVLALTDYVKAHPKAFFDAEIMQVWTLGVAPYTDERLKSNFRLNAFFIGDNTRTAINTGLADYTPIFLSQVPGLFKRRILSVDIALIQTSLPDHHGFLSLGVSVDIVKAAAGSARLIIAQVNPQMPRVQGDGFLHISEVDYVVPFDEPLLEYRSTVPDAIATRIGRYVARIVEDGDTIQVGYGSVPNAIMSALGRKKHLGVHTELLTDGLVDLIRKGVIDNSRKTVDQGKTVTSFCMGSRDTYDFIDGNPTIEFKTIDYTNDPVVIARQERMCAINSVLQIDLTGQATAESIGRSFYSGIGGQADFMRGAIMARGGKSILAMQSTAQDGTVSRIVAFLPEGAGATLNRGDVHYVVTEYGIAHIHGKNVRERAMDLIAIAHPAFRHQLVEEARRLHLVYGDQEFVPGERGEYPEHHETRKTTKAGVPLLLRPVKISDEPALKDFFYSLSDQSMYRRFMTPRRDMPHERLQEFVAIDYGREMVILACLDEGARAPVVGLAEYYIEEDGLTANVAFAVTDRYQNKGVGTELLAHLTQIARRQGLHGFTAEVLRENEAMLRVFEKMKCPLEMSTSGDVYKLKISLK